MPEQKEMEELKRTNQTSKTLATIVTKSKKLIKTAGDPNKDNNSSIEAHPLDYRILSFLIEHKVAVADQIHQFCSSHLTLRATRKVIKALQNEGWISSIRTRNIRPGARHVISLTPDGLKEFRGRYLGAGIEKIQIKSNQPYHDVCLTDLKIAFSRIPSCKLLLPENVIQMQLFEGDLPDLSTFRYLKSDAAAFMDIDGDQVWMALEFECSDKGIQRNIDRFKKWYQTEDLKGVLFVTENDSFRDRLMQIDKAIYPANNRKILFASIQSLSSEAGTVTFQASDGNDLKLIMSKTILPRYPILDQNQSISLAKSCGP